MKVSIGWGDGGWFFKKYNNVYSCETLHTLKMDVEEATTPATTEVENESETETTSTTRGDDDLELETESGDKPNQPETVAILPS